MLCRIVFWLDDFMFSVYFGLKLTYWVLFTVEAKLYIYIYIGSGVSKNGDHSRRTAAIRIYLLSSRQFSAHPKSSRARIDKRTARAARNTRYRYNKIGPLDPKMADNRVSLTRTSTVSSTITKPIKTWKTSNESYWYNLLNRINKMYTHDLFNLQQEWEAWLAPV